MAEPGNAHDGQVQATLGPVRFAVGVYRAESELYDAGKTTLEKFVGEMGHDRCVPSGRSRLSDAAGR